MHRIVIVSDAWSIEEQATYQIFGIRCGSSGPTIDKREQAFPINGVSTHPNNIFSAAASGRWAKYLDNNICKQQAEVRNPDAVRSKMHLSESEIRNTPLESSYMCASKEASL